MTPPFNRLPCARSLPPFGEALVWLVIIGFIIARIAI